MNVREVYEACCLTSMNVVTKMGEYNKIESSEGKRFDFLIVSV
jgi:hypothetical protein